MKISFTAALCLAALVAGALADDNQSTTALVPNNHGGYNVVQPAISDSGAALITNNHGSSDSGTALVTNNHGSYNVVQPGAHAVAIPFFGAGGFASHVIAHSHDKPFILRPVVEDVGHGGKIVVYRKIYFATAEEAEAAKGKP